MALSDDVNTSQYRCADYRVRLFLSVDLSGSTAFKNSETGEKRNGGESPRWVGVFQDFYKDFPSLFSTIYHTRRSDMAGTDMCPVVWKAVGDELILCGRVSNKLSIANALTSFIQALHSYRQTVLGHDKGLNLKGAAWLAAFPEPNRAVQIKRGDGQEGLLSASEALELSADQSPFDFDFLGKAIDTGFRVASTATPERFALSVQLACLLAGTPEGFGFDFPIHINEPVFLKGVNKGEPYPRLFVNTMQHLPTAEMKRQERQILNRPGAPAKDILFNYLMEYCRVVGTDSIMLPSSAEEQSSDLPDNYLKYRDLITEHLQPEEGREPSDDGTGGDGEAVEDEQPLEPVSGEPPDR